MKSREIAPASAANTQQGAGASKQSQYSTNVRHNVQPLTGHQNLAANLPRSRVDGGPGGVPSARQFRRAMASIKRKGGK